MKGQGRKRGKKRRHRENTGKDGKEKKGMMKQSDTFKGIL